MVLAAGDVTEFLSIDLTTIIATLLNTLILFLVLKHFLFDKVNKVIDFFHADAGQGISLRFPAFLLRCSRRVR